MSEILRRLQALRADQAIIVAQEREAKRIREEERQTAKEAERKLSVECGKLLDDLGVNKMLEELNSGVLKNKGKIVNLQGLLPHTHTWDEGSGIDNYSVVSSEEYHPISLRVLTWREKLQGEKVHFWAGVVAGVKDNIIVWIAVGGKNVIDPDHNYGGWFCDTLELHAQRLRIHSREHFATDDLAREVTMDEIVRTFHKITWGSARSG